MTPGARPARGDREAAPPAAGAARSDRYAAGAARHTRRRRQSSRRPQARHKPAAPTRTRTRSSNPHAHPQLQPSCARSRVSPPAASASPRRRESLQQRPSGVRGAPVPSPASPPVPPILTSDGVERRQLSVFAKAGLRVELLLASEAVGRLVVLATVTNTSELSIPAVQVPPEPEPESGPEAERLAARAQPRAPPPCRPSQPVNPSRSFPEAAATPDEGLRILSDRR